MSRTNGVPENEAGIVTRIIFWMAKRKIGRLPLGMRIRALDPKLMKLSLRMDLHTASARTVSMVLKELAQIKVAAMVGCPF